MAVFYTIIAHCTSFQAPGKIQDAHSATHLNKAIAMLEAAACRIAGLLRDARHTPLAVKLNTLLIAARASLDAAISKEQNHCNTAAQLPPQCHKSIWQQLSPFRVDVPAGHALSADVASATHAKAITNLGAFEIPRQPGTLQALIKSAQRSHVETMPKQQAFQLFREVEKWFFTCGVQILAQGSTITCDDLRHLQQTLQQAHSVVLAYSKHLLAFEERHFGGCSADVHTHEPQAGPRSREAVVVWVMLCMAHCCCAAECPAVRDYALPVQPDSLRHLVLGDPQALAALKSVAEYITAVNCAATYGCIFSTRRDQTQQLASRFFAGSFDLQKKFQEEGHLQHSRGQAHWSAVKEKQQSVQELQEELNQARQDHDYKEECMQQALSALKRAQLNANERRRSHNAAAEQTYQNFCQDLENYTSLYATATRTVPGRACHDAYHTANQAARHVEDTEARLKDALRPPPPLQHAMPSTRDHPGACQMLLFFLYPQLTGSFPLLRQYCCAAQQCVLPLSAANEPSTAQNTMAWAADYNMHQISCVYHPAPERQAVEEQTDQLRLFHEVPLLPKPGNDVMLYGPGDGIHYPAPDVSQRLWQGGPVARYARSNFTDPFAPQDPAEVASDFIDSGEYQSWLQVAPRKRQSQLCACLKRCGAYCCNHYSSEDAQPHVEAARGNRVLAEQGDRPAGMSVDQWRVFASLRAYPLQQLRVLCVALREGSLQFVCPRVSALYSPPDQL